MSEAVHQVDFLNGWSIVHFLFWLLVGTIAAWKMSPHASLGKVLLFSLLGAYAWELFELSISRIPGLWSLTESSWNRWVSDPLMALLAVPLAWWGAGRIGIGRPLRTPARALREL